MSTYPIVLCAAASLHSHHEPSRTHLSNDHGVVVHHHVHVVVDVVLVRLRVKNANGETLCVVCLETANLLV